MRKKLRKYFRKSIIMMLVIFVVTLSINLSAVSTISFEKNNLDENEFDVNEDGCCDLLDLDMVAAHYGDNGGLCDVNHDGVVNQYDVQLVESHCDWRNVGSISGRSDTLVYVNPSSQTVAADSTFTVDIECTPGEPIRAFQFSLSFDKDLLQADSVTNVGEIFTNGSYDIFFSDGTIDNVNGKITYVYAAIMMAGNVSSPGRFATISFTSQTTSGISDLGLYDVRVTNETEYVPLNVYNGTVEVDADAPEITDVQATPSIQNIGGYINVSCTVTDNIEVDEVYLHIEYPDSSEENFSITQNKTGNTYSCNRTYQEVGVYTYHIWAKDTSGNHNISSDYNFEIINQPPNTPSSPDPFDGETGVDVDHDLSWIGGDPDPGDTVTYDVYFEADDPTPDVLVSDDQSETTFDPGTLDYGTIYYWQIIAKDSHSETTEGPIWDFTTGLEPNEPPYVPNSPDPFDGETDVDIDHDLSWIGGDPDPGDTVTYDVYFGTSSPPSQVVWGQSGTSYDPGTMSYDQTYYWKIVAEDNHGASSEGSIWEFTTKEEPEPDLECNGELIWKYSKPLSTKTGSFTVENIGDPGSLLDWEVVEWPEWGEWTFTPLSGSDLTPEDDKITVNVSLIPPKQMTFTFEEEFNRGYTGEVKIVNTENSSDYCTIPVYLRTQRNRVVNSPFLQFLQSHPNWFPLLQKLIQQLGYGL